MPVAAHWILFGVVAIAAIVGAKVLDDRDRRRHAQRAGEPSDGRSSIPPSDPPSGTFSTRSRRA